VLDDLTQGGTHAHFGVALAGLSLRATDMHWSYGSGTPITSAAADLALMLCGRISSFHWSQVPGQRPT